MQKTLRHWPERLFNADVEMLKRVAADHHEKLKKLNKSQQ